MEVVCELHSNTGGDTESDSIILIHKQCLFGVESVIFVSCCVACVKATCFPSNSLRPVSVCTDISHHRVLPFNILTLLLNFLNNVVQSNLAIPFFVFFSVTVPLPCQTQV